MKRSKVVLMLLLIVGMGFAIVLSVPPDARPRAVFLLLTAFAAITLTQMIVLRIWERNRN